MKHDDSTLKRRCQGIWIPIEIWENERLTIQEKVLLTEIQSFDHGEGCWASNNYFSKFLNLTKDRAGRLVSSLVQKGFVTSRCVYAEGSKQIVRRYLKVSHNGKCPIAPTGKNTATPTGESTVTPTGENTVDINKIKNNKKEKDISPEMKFQGRSSENYDSENSEKKNLPNDKIKNHHINFSKRILLEQQKRYPTLIKKIDHTKVNGGARILEQLERLDGYDFKSEIKPCLLWAIEDSFWSRNILSCAALRQKGKNGESKFTNILNAWQRENNTTSTSRSGGAAIPVKRPWNAETTKPYEDFLEDPSPANLAQLYRNLQGIEKWVQGIDFEHYQRHTVVYNYYRRWKDYADKLLEWVNDQGWIGKHPSVFDVNGKIWKQFHSKYILPEIFMRDKIKMTWDKY